MTSDDKLISPVVINILGQDRNVRFNFASDIKLKKLLNGRCILKGIDANDPEHFIGLLWAGLIADSKELDKPIKGAGEPSKELEKILDQLAEEVDIAQYGAIIEKLMEAIKIFKPDSKDEAEAAPKAESTEEEKKS